MISFSLEESGLLNILKHISSIMSKSDLPWHQGSKNKEKSVSILRPIGEPRVDMTIKDAQVFLER